MAKARVPFREVDVRRAINGAKAAGMRVTRVEIDTSTGLIIVAAGKPDTVSAQDSANALDAWIRSNGNAKA